MLFKHKYLFISLLLLTIAAINLPTHAQSAARLDSLTNKFALQFQISQNFTLDRFQGTTFSGKYNFGCRSALRVGFSAGVSTSEAEYSEQFLDTSIVYSGNNNVDAYSMTFKTQYLNYFPTSTNVAFFLGGGPFVEFLNNKIEINNSGMSSGFTRKDEAKVFTIGVDFLLGAEWLFTEYMSLSAEYGLRFLYSRAENNRIDTGMKSSSISKGYNIHRGDLNFGLTVYF